MTGSEQLGPAGGSAHDHFLGVRSHLVVIDVEMT
jgi:hypothetical protein